MYLSLLLNIKYWLGLINFFLFKNKIQSPLAHPLTPHPRGQTHLVDTDGRSCGELGALAARASQAWSGPACPTQTKKMHL